MNNTGWICPICSKVHAPWVAECQCDEAGQTSPTYPYQPYLPPYDTGTPPWWPDPRTPYDPIIKFTSGGPALGEPVILSRTRQ